MFRDILVCVDGSPEANRALTQAIDLAESQRARLTILVAVVRAPYWANTPMTAAGITPLINELTSEAKQTLCDAVRRVPDSISVTTLFSEEPICDALAAELERCQHDLIVLGGRRRGAIAGVLHRSASVSRFALRRCQIPVLCVRVDEGDAEAEAEVELLRPTTASAANAAAATPLSTSV